VSDYERVKVGDTLVLGGYRLASVIAVGVRQGGAVGVRVMDGGQYSRFIQDWCVHIATPKQAATLGTWP
jgi:hypothetical protein